MFRTSTFFALALLIPAGAFAAPTIAAVQNNYSYILPGMPNYGIAPGMLFIVTGTGLNSQPLTALQSSAPPGLPTTVNQTSITVTVNGVILHPGIYYTSPTQVAAVLPSSTPLGGGTITLTSGGQTSAPLQIQVVPTALGLDSLYGNGVGPALVTDAGGNVFTASNSASPGQTVVLWGSGLGADTANDDLTFPLKQNNLTSIPLQVFVGGMSATVQYRGRSQYPGVDQVDVTIPAGVPTGCSVSVVAQSGSMVSNTLTIPVNPGGGACSDANVSIAATQAQSLAGRSNIRFGVVSVIQQTGAGGPSSAPVTQNVSSAVFQSLPGAQFAPSRTTGVASLGSCVVTAPIVSNVSTVPVTPQGLDAGAITVSGPNGNHILAASPTIVGVYGDDLPAGFVPSSGISLTFNGAGGKDVGSFSTVVTFPTPLVWTNRNSITPVMRAQGVTVNWTGGSGTYVSIIGSSSASIGGQIVSLGFVCTAPVGAGTFTVPPSVLLAMPQGNGTLIVQNLSNPQTFSASGLDIGISFAGQAYPITPTYQ